MCGAKLAKAVFRLAAEGHRRMLGIHHRLHDTGIAAPRRSDTVEGTTGRNRVRSCFLGNAVVPFADNFRHGEFLAGRTQRLLNAIVPIRIDRGAGNPRTSRTLPPLGMCFTSQSAQMTSKTLLIDIDVDGVFGIDACCQRRPG